MVVKFPKQRVLFGCFFAALWVLVPEIPAQKMEMAIVAFYNLENLFDTLDSPGVNDLEFTPRGEKRWSSVRYWKKIDQIAMVISGLGISENVSGPAIIGLSEVENRAVLNDLVASPYLAHLNYRIVHYDSPDFRGVDVALLYQPRYFHLTSSRPVPLILYDDTGKRSYSRDQLVVSGVFEGEPMHFIVNHWPSRRGGEQRSSPFRMAAARLARSVVDSVEACHREAKVIVMGDFNDDPVNKSVYDILMARHDSHRLRQSQLFNATGEMYENGMGTLAYHGKWNMFDQIILTRSFLKKEQEGYGYYFTRIYNEPFLMQYAGKYRGYPFRTYLGNYYLGGYSDHFPVYVVLVAGH